MVSLLKFIRWRMSVKATSPCLLKPSVRYGSRALFFGFEGEIEMTVTSDGIMLVKPKEQARAGWAAASQELVAAGDDDLVWPEFVNEGDEVLAW